MINPNKSQNIKRIILTLLITSLLCLTLSVIVYRGQNFQNWLHSDYSTNKYVIIIGWFLLFVYFFICLYALWNIDLKENNYLFLFGLQLFTFFIYIISIYCFSTYLLAIVSIIFSIFYIVIILLNLLKNKHYLLMLLIFVAVFLYLYCLFCGLIYYSMEYGTWKN